MLMQATLNKVCGSQKEKKKKKSVNGGEELAEKNKRVIGRGKEVTG